MPPRIFFGRVLPDRIRLTAKDPNIRNSWQPSFRGRVLPADHGSGLVLSGAIGWHRFIKAFSFFLLCYVPVFAVLGVAHAFSMPTRDTPNPAIGGVIFAAAAIAFMGFFITLMAWGNRRGSADAAFLRTWLASALQPES